MLPRLVLVSPNIVKDAMRRPRLPQVTRPLTVVTLALALGAAVVHHGWSNYHQDRPMTLTGKITESAYENPHATIRLATEGKNWFVVLAPTSRMEARGAARSMVEVGATVTVVAYPHKSIQNEARAERITIGDKTIELR